MGSQSTQSVGPVRFLRFFLSTVSIFLLVSLVPGRGSQFSAGPRSKECTAPYLSTGISNLLQPAQAEVVLGQLSTYLAPWGGMMHRGGGNGGGVGVSGRGGRRAEVSWCMCGTYNIQYVQAALCVGSPFTWATRAASARARNTCCTKH